MSLLGKKLFVGQRRFFFHSIAVIRGLNFYNFQSDCSVCNFQSADIFTLMVQQIQKYMPRTEANLHSEEGRSQRVDELE